MLRKFVGLLLLGLAAAAPALAQDMPPARVGRVAFVSGNLSFHAPGETQWSPAGFNYPVAAGGSFRTEPDARTALEIGPTVIALDSGSELDIAALDQRMTQFGLPQGRMYLELPGLDQGQSFEIDLPQGGVWLLRPGSYEITAGGPSEPARVAVFIGSARFSGGGADLTVNGGDMAVLSGAEPIAAHIEPASPDPFVAWARSRGAEPARLAAPRYVSPQMTGYEDLDRYGVWRQAPKYGAVWYPSDPPAGWTPYRDGRWVWVPPWGWTWIDAEPWGFAPSHYGRWAFIGGRWGWVPGQIVPQPVYAPALVAFVGAPAVGFAGAVGPSVGWFPLAPGEAYWPSYSRNAYYIRNVNAASVRNINSVIVGNQGAPPPQIAHAAFANRQFATVVPQQVFAGGQRVAPAAIPVPAAALQHAPVDVHPPRITPATANSASSATAPAGPGRAGIRSPQQPQPAAAAAAAAMPPPHPSAPTQLPAERHPTAPRLVEPAHPAAGVARADPSAHHPPGEPAHPTTPPAPVATRPAFGPAYPPGPERRVPAPPSPAAPRSGPAVTERHPPSAVHPAPPPAVHSASPPPSAPAAAPRSGPGVTQRLPPPPVHSASPPAARTAAPQPHPPAHEHPQGAGKPGAEHGKKGEEGK